MKFCPKILIPLVAMLFFLQCVDYESNNFNNPDVKVFVQQIKSSRYTDEGPSGYVEAPVFKKGDISALLFYAQDHTPVKDFPVNPISSVSPGNYRLSQCLLWTIEKIRVGNYPSLTPALMKKDVSTGKYNIVTTSDDINEVWKLYNEWWQIVDSQPIDSFFDYYSCNPLSGTFYLWY